MKKTFTTKGMTCESCEKIISRQVHKLQGINSFHVDYTTEKSTVDFDEEKTSFAKIKNIIEKKGYICDTSSNKKSYVGWTFAIIGILVLGYFILQYVDSINLPTISQNMGYGLLFVVGLLTGFHCISMCGGFVVSYTTKGAKEGKKPHYLHLSYAIGKTLSYTIIGALFGLVGSIFAFTPMMRGLAGIIAGAFLVLFGLKMLNIFPALRKIRFRFPKFINRFTSKEARAHKNSPLVIGLLNGLMIACGPLQAIYIMAAGTGSMFEGAKLLFIFGLGTLPVLLGFGYLTSFLSGKATHKILKASAIIVIFLGLIMVNRGLTLTGTGYDYNSLTAGFNVLGDSNSNSGNAIELKDGYQIINMEVNRYGWSPDKFVLQKGIPVKWVIEGKEINGCNNAISVPKYGLNFPIKPGTQTIEFTPTETGTISWSCWMGMIPGAFIVQDTVDQNEITGALNAIDLPPASSCGASGGCGCGGPQ